MNSIQITKNFNILIVFEIFKFKISWECQHIMYQSFAIKPQ